jgi:hypothetical protein
MAGSSEMSTVREATELADVVDPAWPSIAAAALAAGDAVQVLPVDPSAGLTTLHRLQVSAASVLGALALNCGGVVVDHGWLRILGGGAEGLPSLAAANGLGKPSSGSAAPPSLTVAFDALGGVFAIDGGGLAVAAGAVCYFGPDTLHWIGLGLGHAAFVTAMLGGATRKFYEDLRWPGWEEEVGELALDQGLSLYPPPFTEEGRDLSAVSRRPVPGAELREFYASAAAQLDP